MNFDKFESIREGVLLFEQSQAFEVAPKRVNEMNNANRTCFLPKTLMLLFIITVVNRYFNRQLFTN